MRIEVFVCLFAAVATSSISNRHLNEILERLETALYQRSPYQNTQDSGYGEIGGDRHYDKKTLDGSRKSKAFRSNGFRKNVNEEAHDDMGPELRHLIRFYNKRLDSRRLIRKQENSTIPSSIPLSSTRADTTPLSTTTPLTSHLTSPSSNTEKPETQHPLSSTTMSPQSPSTTNPPLPSSTPKTSHLNNTSPTPKPGGNSTNTTQRNNTIELLDYIREYQEFNCPTLKFVLMNYFKRFPSTADMSWNITFRLNDSVPVIRRAVATYYYLQNPRLALLQLTENVAQSIVIQRIRCPATKFQNIIIYVLKKELYQALNTSRPESLYMDLWHSMLQSVPSPNHEFIRDVIYAIQSEVIGEVIFGLQRGMFSDLQGLLESVFMKSTEYYLNNKWSFPSESVLQQIFKDAVTYHSRTFHCTSKEKLFNIHREEIKDLRNRFVGNHIFVDLKIESIIEELFKERYSNISSVHRPIDQLIRPINKYLEKVFSLMEKYLQHLDASSTQPVHPMFKQYLDKNQMKVLKDIESALEGGGGTTPDWAHRVKTVMERLRNLGNSPSAHSLNEIIKELEDILEDYM